MYLIRLHRQKLAVFKITNIILIYINILCIILYKKRKERKEKNK